MSAIVIKPDGTQITVQNLGYLLKAWARVNHFIFDKTQADSYHDGDLIAVFHDNTKFITQFASETVLWNVFLRRPVFYGLFVHTIQRDGTRTKEEIVKKNQ